MKKTLIGTGLTGLIGSRLVELYDKNYEFENLSLETGVNILNKDEIINRFDKSNSKYVLHFAAKTDVDGCEKDKELGKEGDAWKINVIGTKNIVLACKKTNKKLIHISTDFVFDGKVNKFYTEDDVPNPLSWYGTTKYEAEKVVMNSNVPYLICRLSYPYRAKCPVKKDFLHAVLEKLQKRENLYGVDDEIITPTFIDDIAAAVIFLLEKNITGLFHVVGSKPLSPYEVCLKIAGMWNLNCDHLHKTSGKDYFRNRAVRPFHAAIKNDKIKAQGINMHTFDEGIKIVKSQMEGN